MAAVRRPASSLLTKPDHEMHHLVRLSSPGLERSGVADGAADVSVACPTCWPPGPQGPTCNCTGLQSREEALSGSDPAVVPGPVLIVARSDGSIVAEIENVSTHHLASGAASATSGCAGGIIDPICPLSGSLSH